MKAYQWIIRDNQILPYNDFIISGVWYTTLEECSKNYPSPYFTVIEPYEPSVIDSEALPEIFKHLTNTSYERTDKRGLD